MSDRYYEEWEPGEQEQSTPESDRERYTGPAGGNSEGQASDTENTGNPDYRYGSGASSDNSDNSQNRNTWSGFGYRYTGDSHQGYNSNGNSGGSYTPPEMTKLVKAALGLSLGSLFMMLAGCCFNVYFLFFAAIMSIAGVVCGILSKTGKRMHPSAVVGIVISVLVLVMTLFTVCSYSWVMRNPAVVEQLESMYESMGYDLDSFK